MHIAKFFLIWTASDALAAKAIVVAKPIFELKSCFESCISQSEIIVKDPTGNQIDFAWIKPGSFIMGRSTTASMIGVFFHGPVDKLDDGPPRKVTITRGYCLAKHKVTVSQYCTFLNDQPETKQEIFVRLSPAAPAARLEKKDGKYIPKKGAENASINTATWLGANAYCQWLSIKIGKPFRLPTEDEWEYAARVPEGRQYPWGNEPSGRHDYEDFRDYKRYPNPWNADPVTAFPHNKTPNGLARMVDAVGEWVSDYYAKYPKKSEIDPIGPKGTEEQKSNFKGLRVLRGRWQTLTDRSAGSPDLKPFLFRGISGIYGFRVLLECEEEPK
jgi:formylglycine-generating enzyme required for sulfatase activity